MNPRYFIRMIQLVLACLFVLGSALSLRAAEPPVSTKVNETTNSNDSLRAYLQLQDQLHATQQALERNREETDRLAARNAEAVASKLKFIEEALAAQRTAEHQAMESTNKLLLIFAGSFAVVGFIAMLLTAYLQWRAVNRLAEFTALIPAAGHAALAMPAAPDAQHLITAGTAEQSNSRLFGALNRLEHRIHELEHTSRPPLAEKSQPTNGAAALENGAATNEPHDQVSILLAKGESLLNLDKGAEALACYDEILASHPDHPEALVKKGVALEQMRQNDDALLCYDRAIAVDSSLTVAYLQKGGLFNRLERYEEALQCYEQALRTQEKGQE